jgi:hypothetical protein
MRIRFSNPSDVDALLADSDLYPQVVLERVADDEVEASLLGSFRADAMTMNLELTLHAWAAARRAEGTDVTFEIL